MKDIREAIKEIDFEGCETLGDAISAVYMVVADYIEDYDRLDITYETAMSGSISFVVKNEEHEWVNLEYDIVEKDESGNFYNKIMDNKVKNISVDII